MSEIDQFIIGDSASYARLCLIAEVLGKFISCTPRALDIAQLQRQTGRSRRELRKLCALLCRERLLQPSQPHAWTLACEASRVTLEDAFRCIVAERSARAKPKAATMNSAETEDAPRREVNLLVMQAAMGINQRVFRHLRQFSLDRLKMGASDMLPARYQDINAGPYPRLSFS